MCLAFAKAEKFPLKNMIKNYIYGDDTITVLNTPVWNRHACSIRNTQLLPVIVGSFKSAVSKLIHRNEDFFDFKWQKSSYEHIIRNEKELFQIRKYIELNPLNWESDENYQVNKR